MLIDPTIAPFLEHGLPGLVIGALFLKLHFNDKFVRNGMMTTIGKCSDAIKEATKSNQHLVTLIEERIPKQTQSNK